MRTSRISRETTKILNAISPRANAASSVPPNRSRPATSIGVQSPTNAAGGDSDSDLSLPPSSFEDDKSAVTTAGSVGSHSRKRKRQTEELVRSTSTISCAEVAATRISPKKTSSRIETANGVADGLLPKKTRRQPAKKVIAGDGEFKVEPPANWEEVYNVTKEMRSRITAPVDTMGCESLAEKTRSPRDQRFQTLVALMLSSQTKDTVTAVAMKNLQANLPGGFALESILAVSPELLNELIIKVGFHNNKTRYIKATAEILRDKYNSDIPDTIEGLVSLPGVGPKMAYLCMSAAWGRDEGIGVDVHVHRITNLWGWHKTKTPEETRAALEAWLPRDKWHDINHLLVGFGQTICLPVGRKCGECALAEKALCPSAVVGVKRKARIKREKVVVEDQRTGEVKVEESVSVDFENAEIKAEDVEPELLDAATKTPESNLADIEDLGIVATTS